MTDDDLKKLRGLAEAATPGPWAWDDGFLWNRETDVGVLNHAGTNWPIDDTNAAFIATARTAVPALLDEIARLQAEHHKLRSGECLGVCTGTDVACQRDCYCSLACQTRDADGSRGDLSRTLVPTSLLERVEQLQAGLSEALDLFDAVWCPEHGHAPKPDRLARAVELRKLVRP